MSQLPYSLITFISKFHVPRCYDYGCPINLAFSNFTQAGSRLPFANFASKIQFLES